MTCGYCADEATSPHVKAEAFWRIECSQSNITPIDRSLRYVTELLDRVQNEYAKAISFASFYLAPSRPLVELADKRQISRTELSGPCPASPRRFGHGGTRATDELVTFGISLNRT